MIPTLLTERLYLIPLSQKHVTEQYVSWLNDADVIRYLESGGNYTKQKLIDFIDEITIKKVLIWAIHLKDSEKHIGNIKIDPINYRHLFCEYGILMGEKNEWGKGYSKEATQAVIQYCFQELKMRKICLGVVEDNHSALSLYKSLKFIIEGIYQKHGFYGGKWCNIVRMALFNPSL